MSSLRRLVGKGMGSIAVEAVYQGFVPLSASHRFHAHPHTSAGMTWEASYYNMRSWQE